MILSISGPSQTILDFLIFVRLVGMARAGLPAARTTRLPALPGPNHYLGITLS